MKKVLVTGAAGAIGINVIKYLLSEGKYEITAIDLPNNNSYKALKKYRKRVNVIFADLTNSVITDGLVKDQDYVIHLASISPVMGNVKKELCDLVDYKMTENIVRAITFYNTECHLLFSSTTTLYKSNLKEVSSSDKVSPLKEDYYSQYKLKCENLITKNLTNYTIFRLPMVLTNPKNVSFVFNGVDDEVIETISDIDASYAFVKALEVTSKLNKKIYNLAGGVNCQIKYRELISKILYVYGISFKYISNKIFVNKNYHGFIYKDSDDLNNILKFRNDGISSYLMRLKRQSKKRIISKILVKPILFVRNMKK